MATTIFSERKKGQQEVEQIMRTLKQEEGLTDRRRLRESLFGRALAGLGDPRGAWTSPG